MLNETSVPAGSLLAWERNNYQKEKCHKIGMLYMQKLFFRVGWTVEDAEFSLSATAVVSM